MGKESTTNITDWINEHFVNFHSSEDSDSLDDLLPLKEMIGNARVVALGENSHFIKEFCQIRFRLIRFLIEECGFDVHALEFGFTEGMDVNNWVHTVDRKEEELKTLLGHFPYPSQIHDTLRWLRNYHLSKKQSVYFAGIDVPKNGGSFFPTLEIVKNFFTEEDPEALIYLNDIWEIAKKIDGFSTAQSAFLLNRLSDIEKNTITAQTNRLIYRLEALAPQHISRLGEKKYQTMYHHLKSIAYLDYNSNAMNGFISGKGISGDLGARDKFMADSVLWHLKESGSKIALVAHNAHIQKLPILYGDFLSCIPMGQRLANTLGNDYLAIGITSSRGHTAALFPDENYPFGFRIENTALEEPISGSIEKLLEDAQVQNGILSFREIPRGDQDPTHIRFDSDYIVTSVLDAFDAIIQVPNSTIADGII